MSCYLMQRHSWSFTLFVNYCSKFLWIEKTLYFNHEFVRNVTYPSFTNVVRCAIWYDLYNLKNVKLPMEECLLKLRLLHGCFPCFLNCKNGTKLRNAPHIVEEVRHGISRVRYVRMCFKRIWFHVCMRLWVLKLFKIASIWFCESPNSLY